MKKALRISLFIIASFCFVASAQAQKFGYVNSAKILSELPSVKQAESNLEALQTQLQKKYQQSVEAFQKKVQGLQQQADEGKLSPLQQQEQGQKLQAEEQEIVKMQNDMVTQLDTKRQELLKPIYDSINAAI
ncbi:MAG: OmpH family outer membrane protein, partial [Bacteroidota bacterium]